MKSHILLVALLALTACAGAEITTPPVMSVPKVPANAVGVDVYAKDRARGNPVPRFRGQKTVQVRTRGKGESSSPVDALRQEIADMKTRIAALEEKVAQLDADVGPSFRSVYEAR